MRLPIDKKEHIANLRSDVALTEQMAIRSEGYAARNPGQRRGALQARSRADQAKQRLDDFIKANMLTEEIAPPPLDVLMSYQGAAGEIVQIATMFQTGEAKLDRVTQIAVFNKLAAVAAVVHKKERTLLDSYDEADAHCEGVPYHGSASDV